MPGWFKPEYAWLLLVTFMWGSGHTAGKIALRELEPGQLALLRPGSAWLVLMALVVLSGRIRPLVSESPWLILGEPLTLPVILGAIAIMAGVGLSQVEDFRLLRRTKSIARF